MKKYFYILLFIYLNNFIAMENKGWLEAYQKRVGIASTDRDKSISTKAVQDELNKQREKQLFISYVVVPIATFVAATAVFNTYKNL